VIREFIALRCEGLNVFIAFFVKKAGSATFIIAIVSMVFILAVITVGVIKIEFLRAIKRDFFVQTKLAVDK
jgi:hypothetical protein